MSRRFPKKYHLFFNWLKANRSRFKVQPYILKIGKGNFVYGRFTGVTSAIDFYLRENCIEVQVFYKKEFWNIVGDFELQYSVPDEISSYSSDARKALLTEYVFEDFLYWCNEILAASRWLAIYKFGNGGSTTTEFLTDDNLKCVFKNGKAIQTYNDNDLTEYLVRKIPVFTNYYKRLKIRCY